MKRMLDIGLGIVMLVVFAPAFALLSLFIALDGGQIFYGHHRVGRGGKTFACYKFRTMIVGAHECLDEYLALHPAAAVEWRNNQKLDNDLRITPVGRFLRRTSLDELPQIWNVLRGEMSLVGPRPVTQIELARYGDNVDRLLSVRPGMTGLWQVSGRNRLSYSERVALDMRYIANRSLWRDCIILFKTIRVLLQRDGK